MANASEPQVDPTNPNDETSFLASQATWSATSLPVILGRLDPPPGWSTEPRPQQLVENGKKVFRGDKPILDYDIPRYIASPANLETWRLEAWFRTHRCISYDDIWVRQPNWVPKPTNTQKNALNQKRLREVRKPLNARSWMPSPRCPGVSKVMVEFVERLTQNEIDQNTNWKVVLGGIQQPNNPARVLPLGTFLTDGQIHTPSNRVADAVLELQRLRVLAASHGMAHWGDLPNDILPMTWTMRLKKPRKGLSIEASQVEKSSIRRKQTEQTEDDSESAGDDDDKPGPISAGNNKKIRKPKATQMTSSYGKDADRRELHEEHNLIHSSVREVFSGVNQIAADVRKTFYEVEADFQVAIPSLEHDYTNISRLPRLPMANVNAVKVQKPFPEEFMLDFTQEPALWELMGPHRPYATIPAIKTTTELRAKADTQISTVEEQEQEQKRSFEEYLKDMSPDLDAWEESCRKLRSRPTSPTAETHEEVNDAHAKRNGAKRRKTVKQEYN